MPISDKKLKSVFEQGLRSYIDRKKAASTNNDPSQTAKRIKNLIEDFLEDLDEELDNVGRFMRPGLKRAIKNYIDKKFDQKL